MEIVTWIFSVWQHVSCESRSQNFAISNAVARSPTSQAFKPRDGCTHLVALLAGERMHCVPALVSKMLPIDAPGAIRC